MAISGLLVRAGIGSWSDIAHLITRGLDIGAPPPPPIDIVLPIFAPISSATVSGSGAMANSVMTGAGAMTNRLPVFAKIRNTVMTSAGGMENTTITAEGAFV